MNIEGMVEGASGALLALAILGLLGAIGTVGFEDEPWPWWGFVSAALLVVGAAGLGLVS